MNIHHRRSFKRRLHTAVTAGMMIAIVPLIQAQDEKKPAAPDETVKLEAFTVTGSHITGIDTAGLNPLATISRLDLELGGFSTVGDAIRSLPIVSGSSLLPAGSNNSFTPGASSANLRGLGNNNALVLLNGRRAAPLSSPGFNGLQTIFDFNSIPSAAVEGIDILKDGGSAIYGSDAVSGVINIRLRKNFSGTSVSAGLGNTVGNDSLEKKFALTFGSASGANSVVFSLDWTQREKIKDHDYGFSSNANLTSRGGSDLRSYAGFPALVYVPSLGDYYTTASPVTNPTLANFQVADVSHGSYNFQSVTDQIPETRNYGFYVHANHDFSDSLYGFAEVSFRRQESSIEAAPSPVFNYAEHGDGPNTGALNIPTTNPNNPFGENLEDEWYLRMVNAGNRINDVISDTPRLLVGLGGKIPSSTWSWETGALYTRNDTSNRNGGSAFDNLYQNALNGITIGGQTLYANPFGPEDPRVTAYYTHDNPTHSTFELRTYDASASGQLWDLPAGPLGLAVGAEFRTEKLANVQTVDNITGNIIGGAEGDSTFGQRDVKATYAEFRVPLATGLQLQVAGRYEKYSDFGSATKPKYALSYRPVKWLLLRGSYGQSFLAPNLAYLYTSQVTTFSDNPLPDPKRPADAPRQIQTKGGGNPNLKPETTDSYYAGFQIEPTSGALKGWSFSVDGFEFKQTSLIAQLGADFILSHEDALPAGRAQCPGRRGNRGHHQLHQRHLPERRHPDLQGRGFRRAVRSVERATGPHALHRGLHLHRQPDLQRQRSRRHLQRAAVPEQLHGRLGARRLVRGRAGEPHRALRQLLRCQPGRFADHRQPAGHLLGSLEQQDHARRPQRLRPRSSVRPAFRDGLQRQHQRS